jgi:hypothetical protein
VCILAKGSVIATSPAYHDHPPQRLLQNFPDTTNSPPIAAPAATSSDPSDSVVVMGQSNRITLVVLS